MDVNEINIGLPALIAVVSSLGSGMAVWYRLKNKLNIKEEKIKQIKIDLTNVHIRINDLKMEHRKLYEDFNQFEKDYYKNN